MDHFDRHKKSMFKAASAMLLINVAVTFGVIWLGLSLLTSGVKVWSNDCDITYGIEAIASGDWFCPVK